MVARRRSSITFDFPWDDQLYEKLKAENEEELQTFQKEEEEAAEQAGDTEVQAAKGKRAEFWARVGDKVWKLSYIPCHLLHELTPPTHSRKKLSPLTKPSLKKPVF